MEAHTKQIQCPHMEHSKHKATLYVFPHKFAGIWECRYGYSDSHEHGDYEIETVAVNYMRDGEADQYEQEIYVCGGEEGCGETIEDANPAEDRADALAEAMAS